LHATISGNEIQGARPTGKIHISNANWSRNLFGFFSSNIFVHYSGFHHVLV
jgi:hypothetical protein